MDELVSSVHLGFLFYELLEDARVERGPKGGKWNLDFLDPVLVWRVCRLCILVDHHRFLVLLFLHLLDVWRLKRHLSLTQERSPLGPAGTLLATNQAIQGLIRPGKRSKPWWRGWRCHVGRRRARCPRQNPSLNAPGRLYWAWNSRTRRVGLKNA